MVINYGKKKETKIINKIIWKFFLLWRFVVNDLGEISAFKWENFDGLVIEIFFLLLNMGTIRDRFFEGIFNIKFK